MRIFVIILLIAIVLNACSNEEDIFEIKEYFITCNENELKNIYDNFKEDTYIPITITCKNETIPNAKMRIRGDTSREDPKKSLKIKLPKPFEGEKNKSINFNAEYTDKSYIRQFISSKIMREAGVTCFTSQYARIYINGTFFGLYLNVENIDENFIKEHNLNMNANMYKAKKDGACLSLEDKIENVWEKKLNINTDWQDLELLIYQLDTIKDKYFHDFLINNFEYENIITVVAINMLVQNSSTYYHNYYMYHDIYGNGKWQMFPWDLDKSLSYYSWKPYVFFETTNKWLSDNVLVEKMFINEKVRADLIKKVNELGISVFNNKNIDTIIDKLSELLENSVESDTTDQINSVKNWKDALQNEKKFISQQVKYIINQLTTFPTGFEVERINNTQISPPVLKWNHSKSPIGKNITYTVYYSQDYLFENKNSTKIIENVIDTFYRLPKTLGIGKYFWKIVATDGQNKIDGFNRFNYFEYKVPTEIKNDISSNVVLDKEHSPYFIYNKINVNQNSTLTIKAGTDIILKEGAGLNVYGKLIIEGEENNFVVFRPANNEWGEIYIYNSDATINYAKFNEGVFRGKESKLKITNSIFTINKKNLLYDGFRQAVIWISGGEFTLNHSKIFGNGLGEGMNINSAKTLVEYSYFNNTPDAIELLKVVNGHVHHNFVENSPDDAIDMNGCKNILVENNYLYNNNDKAISVGTEEYGPSFGAVLRNNLIIENGTAFSVKDSSDAHIYNNTLINNNTGFVAYLKNNPDLKLHYSVGGKIKSEKNIIYNCKITDLKIDKDSKIEITDCVSSKSELQGKGNYKSDISFANLERGNYQIINSVNNTGIGYRETNDYFLTLENKQSYLILKNPNLFPVNIYEFILKIKGKTFTLPNYQMFGGEEIIIVRSSEDLSKTLSNRMIEFNKLKLNGEKISLVDNKNNIVFELNEYE